MINPGDYGINLNEAKPIDRMESSVYVGRDQNGKKVVLKIYDGYRAEIIDVEVLRHYAQLTEAVKTVCENSAVMRADLGYELEIVPVLMIGRLSGGSRSVSVCEFVPGDNLWEAKAAELVKSKLRRRLVKVNSYLQQRLSEKGIRIDLVNIKLNEVERKLIVTDVCGVVAVLSPDFYGCF